MSGQKNSGREDSRGGIFGKRKPKVAKIDFTEASLPHSRRDVFRDVLKNRWKDLLKLGALLLLFSLPLLVFGAVGEINAANIYAEYKNGAISAETCASEVAASNGAFALIKIIGYIIFSVGIAGSARVLRQIIWDEPLFFFEDFKDGIKIYGGQFALAMFLYGLCAYTAVFFSSATNGILYAIALGLGVFILLPAMFFWLSERTVYASRIGENIRNGFMFYVRTLFKSIGMLLLAFLPFTLEYVLEFFGLYNFIFKYSYLLICTFLFLPLGIMLWLLYTYSVFDKYINAELFPEILHKGFYPSGTEETAAEQSVSDKAAVERSEKTSKETLKEQTDESDKKE
ncbi:MAG TPA: hypothetical protein DHU65_00710 [Clostridiales bacterium]|nr:hypothetical protein [Clostridiales bacterium]